MRAVLILVLCGCVTGPGEPPAVRRYVVSSETFAVTTIEASGLSVDLNGDRATDNRLGQLFAGLRTYGLWPFADSARMIDRGQVITLLELPGDAEVGQSIHPTIYTGANPDPTSCADDLDPTCRGHLDGTGHFAIADTTLPLDMYGGIVALYAFGPRVELDRVEPGLVAGRIGFALRKVDIDTTLAPALAAYLEPLIARECSARNDPPNCACTSASDAAGFAVYAFDDNHDCAVTVEEIVKSPAMTNWTAPDVLIDREDGTSFGFGFEAVPARF